MLITVLVICDAAATVLHADAEGAVANIVRRTVWRSTVLASARLPRVERSVLSLAGPVTVTTTFVSWIILVTLGLALTVWPMLATDFEIQPDLTPLSFLDAFYFAGGTVTVLGYGDLTPRTAEGQLISLFGAAAGFTMFTGMATYIIQIISGVTTRNLFTLSVHDEVQGRGGVSVVAQYLAEEGPTGLRAHSRNWGNGLRKVDEMVRRHPLVAFTYRSGREDCDPEPALHRLAEATVATLVASRHEPALRTSAESLRLSLTRLQMTIATTYLGDELARRLRDPRPTEDDHKAVETTDRLLSDRLGWSGSATGPGDAAATVCACRIFLDGLRSWGTAEALPYEWAGSDGSG